MRNRTTEWRNGKTLLLSTISALAVACGAADEPEGTLVEQSDLTLPSAFAAESGLRFVEVVANGSGCPAGSWRAEIAQDRRSFTVALDDYAAEAGGQRRLAVEGCSLAIKVGGSVSYAVESFGFTGRAELARGASAAAAASYAIQGEGTADEVSVSLLGPYRDAFRVESTVPEGERRWSTCGVDRDLNFRTHLRANAGVEGAAASIAAASLEGSLGGGLGVRFAVRGCEESSARAQPSEDDIVVAPESPRTDWADPEAPNAGEEELPEGAVVIDTTRDDQAPGPVVVDVTRTDASDAEERAPEVRRE